MILWTSQFRSTSSPLVLTSLTQFLIVCRRHFQDAAARDSHVKTNVHRRRVKELEKAAPYTGDEHVKIDNGGPVVRAESST